MIDSIYGSDELVWLTNSCKWKAPWCRHSNQHEYLILSGKLFKQRPRACYSAVLRYSVLAYTRHLQFKSFSSCLLEGELEFLKGSWGGGIQTTTLPFVGRGMEIFLNNTLVANKWRVSYFNSRQGYAM